MSQSEDGPLLRWEGGMIQQIHRLTGVLHKLTKQLNNGAVDSEVKGAYMDLRFIAGEIERLHNQIPR